MSETPSQRPFLLAAPLPGAAPISPVVAATGDGDDLTDLMAAFRRFQTQNARVLTRESAARGLNATDTRLVFFLETATGGATPKQAGEYLGLSTGATTSLIDRLERHGHLERRPNPTDRRSVLLHLTPSGAAVAQQISAVWSAAVREVVAPADRARLATQFSLFGTALERHSGATSV
ncbi:MarR family winged helix-turn-helix transcriptional regulator [Curtobacterium sp. PsM8]|uniref:MarR family winged helix-turn-helix transcriptional regulator n=1 Tax=Curtobacterium sp. PsM8 TaxID=3030532 RepID=UPI00263A7E67|nr:MarR family transcriptional regulator [Curtobacterium sp. PsM8]MDN4647296.1 MarR family transcriptional regulator [Curtobacterium sp. PsM8]